MRASAHARHSGIERAPGVPRKRRTRHVSEPAAEVVRWVCVVNDGEGIRETMRVIAASTAGTVAKPFDDLDTPLAARWGGQVFAGRGEMGAVLAGIDWTRAPLGSVERLLVHTAARS